MKAARFVLSAVALLSLAVMTTPARAQGEADLTGGNAPNPLPAGNLSMAAAPASGFESSGIGALREQIVLAAYFWLLERPVTLPNHVREQTAVRRSSKRRR